MYIPGFRVDYGHRYLLVDRNLCFVKRFPGGDEIENRQP